MTVAAAGADVVEVPRTELEGLRERAQLYTSHVFSLIFDRAQRLGHVSSADGPDLLELWLEDPEAARTVMSHAWAETA